MATIQNEILTKASAEDVWDVLRDVGALHTRLVPGFVIDTVLEPGARIVTFFNGEKAREIIVTIDEERKRLVWGAESPSLKHYNASAQVLDEDGQTRFLWTADFLPDDAAERIAYLMGTGIKAAKVALDKLAEEA